MVAAAQVKAITAPVITTLVITIPATMALALALALATVTQVQAVMGIPVILEATVALARHHPRRQ